MSAAGNRTGPLHFIFGLHLHQPVGNFDHVFAEHVERVYRPLLERLVEREFFPLVLHLSGPLIEWLEAHEPAYLDLVGRLAGDGRVELLAAGWYEPVLAALLRRDRIEQVEWMRASLRRRFGVDARSLWLTERVWSPELPADLADAGVRAALVDDRHFLVTGFRREQLHAPIWTEADDRRLALFPIDERLRYLIPFRPPEETADYLRGLHGAGHRLAVLADDGEKFGGWPGTHEWVYERGWLARFLDTMEDLVAGGTVRLTTLEAALAAVPSGGLAYLPTASYREMEAWSLTPPAALRLARLEYDLGEERMAGPDGALVRGAHWRNFLAKYPESNRMHKKAQRLSVVCRERGDPGQVRTAIGRAQCNDAYWHGVFGGLYLPHLREAIWRSLSEAEGALRRGEPLGVEALDLDADGDVELWIHSEHFSALVSPRRGGAIEELTYFASAVNCADVLTRRREAYHQAAVDGSASQGTEGGAASIHDIERGLRLESLPPADLDDRAILQERVLAGGIDEQAYAAAAYEPRTSWTRTAARYTIEASESGIEVRLEAGEGNGTLHKALHFAPDGTIVADYRWDPAIASPDDIFAVELSLSRPVGLVADAGEPEWRHEVATVSKSERGLDHTRQGESVTLRWRMDQGRARLRIAPPATE